MREIKFRAWDKSKKSWKGMCIFRGGHANAIDYPKEPEIFSLSDYFGQTVEIMQYTGLKDADGVEVYEGDIVIVRRFEKWHKGEVRWSESVGGWIFHCHWDKTPKSDYYGLRPQEVSRIQVIGNVWGEHDN